jgi:hypothetical protein
VTCCGTHWVDLDPPDMVDVVRVAGLGLVDIPDGPSRVALGDIVAVPADRAAALVAGGEFAYPPDSTAVAAEED